MNIRRKVIIALGAGSIAMPLRIFAQQQSKQWRIGVLSPLPSASDEQFRIAREQFRDLGYIEGKTVSFDYLSSEGSYDRLPTLAAELVRRNVDIILAAGGTPSVLAAKKATQTIPIVFIGVADPVGQGVVASLAKPGGNVTGIASQQVETAVRTLALLKETIPAAERVVIFSNPTNLSLTAVVRQLLAAAKSLHVELTVINVKAPAEFEKAFDEIAKIKPAGLVVLIDTMFQNEARRITALAAKARLPTMGGHTAIPENGGLMSYGANRADLVRHAVMLVDKVLKNAKKADNPPIMQPTKFDLVLNKKTAKMLGINFPNSVIVQATQVIE